MKQFVQLIPKTARARQITREHGERWEVMRVEDVDWKDGHGPVLCALVTPDTLLEGQTRIDAARWVRMNNDKKFDVIS